MFSLGLHKYRIALLEHPLTRDQKIKTIKRILQWKINRIVNPYPFIYPLVGETSLIAYNKMRGDEMNFYTGLSEFPEMVFLLHFLKEGDLFVDIGANIGSYSVLASGVRKANSITIEPIPKTYKIVLKNIFINNLQDRITPLNIGVGNKKSTLKFTNITSDVQNHVLTKEEEQTTDCLEVPVDFLDNILEKHSPTLFKIDVEGFEMPVLQGAKNTLQKQSLKAMIIEFNKLGERYGYSDEEIHSFIINYGFKPYSYDPFSRTLKEEPSYIMPNTFYIRDKDFIDQRLKESPYITLFKKRF